MPNPWRRLSSQRRGGSSVFTPRLARLWIVLPLWLVTGYGVIWVINHYVSGNEALVGTGAPQIEITKVVLTLTAGVGAVLAGVYAYRKQRLEEGSSHRADAATFADRYNSSVDQLGSDAASIRLAGAYAMARLADDWTEQRQVCVDVLCGYLRMTRPTDPAAAADGPAQEQEVRVTIQTLMAAHLRDPDDSRSWSHLNFNLERARLVDLDLSLVTFSGHETSFRKATFSGHETTFHGAAFSSARTWFDDATFSGHGTWFVAATFSGHETLFVRATFSSEETSFTEASFSGHGTWFIGATFSGDETWFDRATFSGHGTSFTEVTFSSDMTSFTEATFSGHGTWFDRANFSGHETWFDRTTFSSEETSFTEASFSGRALNLPLPSFRGPVTFQGSIWRGPGKFSFDSPSAPQPDASVCVTWNKVQLLDGAEVILAGKPFNGWPPNQPADPQGN